eukprot:CAMPEP_0115007054 /NCGR_PEP_ID=MMETSP0216-20121206/20910_1 /TAXON_ID=223996 /ORGANISM="Protocruzia adherens, Strain Boccale" /LENGTH=46 /DNA_ID= /DNA_START= /DNA_END= /DNA_ORIENTATION=
MASISRGDSGRMSPPMCSRFKNTTWNNLESGNAARPISLEKSLASN